MRKILLLSTIILLILSGFILINSIKIPAPTKEKVYDIPIDQFT
tara:strand:+ start:442 stop:573 length:132 start_codon:yes stop_codon:yes gene_type:complete